MIEKGVLIPVKPGEVAVGQTLPWSLYGRGGNLIAPAGFLVGTDSQRDRVLAVRVYREANDQDVAASRAKEEAEEETPRAPRDGLADLRHNVEFAQLNFQLDPEMPQITAAVHFMGKVTHQAVLISAPVLPGRHTWREVDEGFPLKMRMMTGRSAYSFNTRLVRFSALPVPHLFLQYPTQVSHQQLRGAVRLRETLKGIAVLPDGKRHPVELDNLSGDGCGIETALPLGEAGGSFELVFRIQVREQSYTLNLPAIIRNKRNQKTRQVYGIQFGSLNDPLEQTLRLALEAYLYERIATE